MHRINILQVCQNISSTWILNTLLVFYIYNNHNVHHFSIFYNISIFSFLSLCVSKCVAWKNIPYLFSSLYIYICINIQVHESQNRDKKFLTFITAHVYSWYKSSTRTWGCWHYSDVFIPGINPINLEPRWPIEVLSLKTSRGTDTRSLISIRTISAGDTAIMIRFEGDMLC